MRLHPLLAPILLLSLAAGCSDSGGDSRLRLDVTDAPVDDATEVVIEFTGVELERAGGQRLNFDYASPRRIDLLDLTGVESAAILDEPVPSGDYAWVRLKVNTSRTQADSFIRLADGSVHPLFVPSGAESGLKLNGGIRVPEEGTGAFTIDFDLRRSVHEPQNAGDAYFLRPVLRLVDSGQVGAIRGSVAASLVVAGCTPAVYAWSGSGVTPDDAGGTTPPYDSAIVELDAATGAWLYTLGFLPPGAYTLAFTCEAALDDPATNDTIAFGPPRNVTVTTGAFATADFP